MSRNLHGFQIDGQVTIVTDGLTQTSMEMPHTRFAS